MPQVARECDTACSVCSVMLPFGAANRLFQGQAAWRSQRMYSGCRAAGGAVTRKQGAAVQLAGSPPEIGGMPAGE